MAVIEHLGRQSQMLVRRTSPAATVGLSTRNSTSSILPPGSIDLQALLGGHPLQLRPDEPLALPWSTTTSTERMAST